jgi:hypothetical protein
MLTVVIPIGSKSYNGDSSDKLPIWLENIENRSLAIWSLLHIEKLKTQKRYLIIAEEKYFDEYNIDKVLSLHTNSEVDIVRLRKPTQGMPCSLLMAIENFKDTDPVFITSIDQYIDTDLNQHIDFFKQQNASAGCIGFESVHPKWSYAKFDQQGFIKEVSEKNPISTHALTSSYYFSNAALMFDAIRANILRGQKVKEKFYLAPCLNELILRNSSVLYSKLGDDKYFNFYNNQVVEEFSRYIHKKDNPNIMITKNYAHMFQNRNIKGLEEVFSPSISLVDSFTPRIVGKENVLKFYLDLFFRIKHLEFRPLLISAIGDNQTIIKFELDIDGDIFRGVDLLQFENNKIVSLEAFLYKI